MTDSKTMNSKHISDNNALYEPARSNNFEFLAFGLDNLFESAEGGVKGKQIVNAGEIIRVSVDEASVPHFELGVIEIQRGNSKVKFAGTPTFNAGTLKLNDYIGARTKDVFIAWRDLAYDVTTEAVHMASNYKKDCQLIEYSPDYSEQIRIWELKGCWVSNISEGNFSNSGNDKRTFEVTIQYDRALPHRPDEVVNI